MFTIDHIITVGYIDNRIMHPDKAADDYVFVDTGKPSSYITAGDSTPKKTQIATHIKLGLVEFYKDMNSLSFPEVAKLFDTYRIWQWVDDDYDFLHCEGIGEQYDDSLAYLHAQGYDISKLIDLSDGF
jgi:hypothetical protein